ncbi:MAG: WG repeat-containing protein [Prevotella sp.]|jgi:hypothetical protein|nr:WG repeat-containing protein [Prevotella sp.]
MKRIFLLFLLLLPVVFCKDISAQGFLKKVAKSIESASKEVDKVLGTDTKSQSQSQQTQTDNTQPAKSVATAKQEAKVIKPFISPNTKTILLDKAGKLAEFHDGLAFVEKVKKVGYNETSTWGVIDTEGNVVVDFVIDLKAYTTNEGPHYNSGMCVLSGLQYPSAAAKTAGMLVVDKRGKVVKTLPDAGAYTQFKDSIAHIRLTLPDPKKSTAYRKAYFYRFAYVNTKGEVVYPHLTADVYPEAGSLYAPEISGLRGVSEGLRSYWSYKTGRGFIDTKGDVIVQPVYRATHDFSDGLAAVQNWEQKWGFIDKTGKLVIDFIFTNEPQDFHEGLAIIQKRDNSRCFIDKSGNIIDKIGKYNLFLDWSKGFIDGKAFVGLREYDGYNTVHVVLDRNLTNFTKLDTYYKDELVDLFPKLAAYRDGLYYFTNGAILTDKLQTVSYYYNFRAYDNFDYYTCFQLENGLARWPSDSGNNYPEGFERCYVDKTGEVKILFKEPEF